MPKAANIKLQPIITIFPLSKIKDFDSPTRGVGISFELCNKFPLGGSMGAAVNQRF